MNRKMPITLSAIFLLIAFIPCQLLAASITETSAAIGKDCVANGNASTAMGYNTLASKSYSTAMGYNTIASGNASTAMGYNTLARGYYSTAMGYNTKAYSVCETVIGRYSTSDSIGSITEWKSSDRLFVIGNGSSSTQPSDAVVVLKNGNVGIGTSTPEEELEIYGNYPYVKLNGHQSSDARQVGVNNYGFVIYNADDAQYEMVINNLGNVGIGATTVYYKLQVNGDAGGNSWTNFSSKEFKEDVRKLDETAYRMMLSKVTDMDLTTYKYKEKYGGDGTEKLGFIAEDMPKEVLSKDGKGVDLYELLSLTIGAMKAQQKQIEELKEQVRILKEK